MAPGFIRSVWEHVRRWAIWKHRPPSAARAGVLQGPDDNLAAEFFRGLRTAKWVDEGLLTWEAFHPEFNAKSWSDGRAAAQLETSINWNDDSSVLAATMTGQNGRFGAGRVQRTHVEQLAKLRNAPGLSLERKLDPENPENVHHGNILFAPGMNRGVIKALANAIALDAEFIAPLKSENKSLGK